MRELHLILKTFGTGVEDLLHRFAIAEWGVTSGIYGGCIHSSDLIALTID